MPSLKFEDIHEFWDEYDRKSLYRIVVSMQRCEYWTLDSRPKVNKLIEILGELIDKNKRIKFSEESLIRILINTCTPRAMRILYALEMNNPGTAGKIISYAEENAKEGSFLKSTDYYCQAFIKRNMVFERMQLLARIFHPQRLLLVNHALEKFYDA